MKTSNTITINKHASVVWKILAHDFDKAQDWMAAVPKSHKINEGLVTNGSPMVGRVCELSKKPNGPKADERITEYDDENMRMKVKIVPINAPFPINYNILDISVRVINDTSSKVIWKANPNLKFMGYVLYPVLKMGLSKAFNEVLEELKYYVEEGKPHPRKVKKMNK